MPHRRKPMFVGAKRAADLVRDLVNVVREVNERRHARDAVREPDLDEVRREKSRDAHGPHA